MASTTLTKYRTRVAAIVGLDNSTSGDQGLIDDWVNEGYEELCLKSRFKLRRADITLTASEPEYSLPSGALAIMEAYTTASSVNYPLEAVTLRELVDLRALSSSSPPRCIYLAGDYVEVWPAPATGDTLTVYYVPRPTALSTGTDVPSDLPAEYHQLIEYYALARAAEYDANGPSQFGLHWRALYEKGLGEMRAQRQRGMKPARAKVGRHARIVSDPSVIQH